LQITIFNDGHVNHLYIRINVAMPIKTGMKNHGKLFGFPDEKTSSLISQVDGNESCAASASITFFILSLVFSDSFSWVDIHIVLFYSI